MIPKIKEQKTETKITTLLKSQSAVEGRIGERSGALGPLKGDEG